MSMTSYIWTEGADRENSAIKTEIEKDKNNKKTNHHTRARVYTNFKSNENSMSKQKLLRFDNNYWNSAWEQ